MGRILMAAISAGLLVGCVTPPTRDQVAEWTMLQAGRTAPSNAGFFSDCMVDGFDKSHTVPTAYHARQVRRTNLTRVESLVDNTIVISADIHDDGRVELFESSIASLLNLKGEKAAFADCLKRYRSE